MPLGVLLELTISGSNRREKVVKLGQDLVTVVVPTGGAILQHFVIGFFCLLDNSFKANVATHLMSVVIKGQQGQ